MRVVAFIAMLLVAATGAAAKLPCAAYLDRNVSTSLYGDWPSRRTVSDDIDHIRWATCRAGTHPVERWAHDGLRKALIGPFGTTEQFCAASDADIAARISRADLDEAHRALIGNASGCFNESHHVEVYAVHPGLESPFPEYNTARHRVFYITQVNAEAAILRAIRFPKGRVECDPKSMPLYGARLGRAVIYCRRLDDQPVDVVLEIGNPDRRFTMHLR